MKNKFNKGMLLLVALLCSVFSWAQGGDNSKFYASLNYQPGWASLENPPYGIYSFGEDSHIHLDPVFMNPKLQVNGGAVYIDGKYYMISYDTYDDGSIYNVYYRIFDLNNDAKLETELVLNGRMSEIPTDLTYDPSTDEVYGCFYQNDGTFVLGILNLNTGHYEKVGSLREQLVALACNREGELYGVGIYGAFFKIDKASAATTQVGPTGLVVRYAQSATFDYETGKLYWASSMHDVSAENGFYEIDITTGKPRMIANFPNQSSMTGLYNKSTYTLAKAPAKADLKLEYTDASLAGKVSFAMPATCFDGSTLSGDLEYTLWVDDVQMKSGKAKAGQQMSINHTFATEGYHWAKLSVKNATGRAPHCGARAWIGNDDAVATDVVATVDNQVAEISWKAPVIGIHGGYVASDKVSYIVTRQQDGVLVYEGKNTTCSDANEVESFGKYWYDVTTVIDGNESGVASSNEVALGKAMTLPYTQGFDNPRGFSLFTVIDANNDGHTWYFDRDLRCASYSFSDHGAADDWLVTPPMDMDTEQVYSLTFSLCEGDGNFIEKLKVAMGNGSQVKDLTKVLKDTINIDWGEEYEEMTVEFIPEKKGANYIGFQACSDADCFVINLDDVKIKQLASVHAPAAATNLKVVPGDKGELSATVECKLPSTTIKGERLSSIDRVELYCNGTLMQEKKGVTPGKNLKFDQVAFNKSGIYRFEVVVCNEYGSGLRVKDSKFVGEDAPAYIPNLKAKMDAKGKVTLTWDVPSVGKNNGYVNPDDLMYTITECDNVKHGTVKETSFTTKVDVNLDKQELLWFDVKATSFLSSGYRTYTDTLFVGKPYPMPFRESFYHGRFEQNPWNIVSDGVGLWEVRSYTGYDGGDPQDGDGGMIAFVPYFSGKQASLTMPKVSLKDAVHPTLRFWAWHNDATHNTMHVILHTSDGAEKELIAIEQDQVNSPAGYEWRFYEIVLDEYVKGSDYIQIEFFGKNKYTEFGEANLMLIDNIDVLSYYEQDLKFVGVTNELEVPVGKAIDFNVNVANIGSKPVESYQVELYRDDRLVNTVDGGKLGVGDSIQVTVQDIPNADASETSYYHVFVRLEGDEHVENNASEKLVVTILPGIPYIDTLKGYAQDGKAVLSWKSPVDEQAAGSDGYITDDFESYAAFSITNVGRWKLYDGDKENTFGIQDGNGDFVQYPNQGAKMAFMVFNPSEAGLDATWNAYSGKQVMACFFGYRKANDDWLISPMVDGAQTISFRAQSTHSEMYSSRESIEVLYSTTDDDVKSFTRIGNTETVPGTWKKYSYKLPEGTKYFAIRCVSNVQFVLYVDDVTYRPATSNLSLKGYNVFRDGKKLNTELITKPAYEEVFPGDDTYTYQVNAVYANCESILSNKVALDKTSSVDEIMNSQVEVVSLDGMVNIHGAEQKPVVIFTPEGLPVFQGEGDVSVALQNGIYIVKVAEEVFKVSVNN